MLGVEETLDVTSGIRQGCTVSTELFKLVTYEIIKKLEETGDKVMIEGIDFSSLFYADDSILVAVCYTGQNLGIASHNYF